MVAFSLVFFCLFRALDLYHVLLVCALSDRYYIVVEKLSLCAMFSQTRPDIRLISHLTNRMFVLINIESLISQLQAGLMLFQHLHIIGSLFAQHAAKQIPPIANRAIWPSHASISIVYSSLNEEMLLLIDRHVQLDSVHE